MRLSKVDWGPLLYVVRATLLLGGIGYLVHSGCQPPDQPEVVSRGLKPNEISKTVVVGSKATVYKRRLDGRVERLQVFVPPEAPVTVVTNTGGGQSVKVSRVGVCFAPGVGVSFGSSQRLVFDAKLVYAGRYSLLVGVPVTGGWEGWQGPYGAIGYHVYRNTSIYGGYAPLSSKAVVGVRISF